MHRIILVAARLVRQRKKLSGRTSDLLYGDLTLYNSLSRAAEVIESAQQPDVHEDYQVTLARLEEIVTGQLIPADDAMEDWKDIFPDDVLDDWAEDWLENGLDNQGYILLDNAKWADLKSQNDDTTEAKQ